MSSGAYSDLKAAWHIDKISALRRGEQIVPAQVQLILSDLCNQDCHFCLAGGALVDTLSGLTPIEAIRVGDLVWGPDGSLQRVTATSSRVVQRVYRITVGDNYIDASEEHPLLSVDGWQEAGSVRPGGGTVVRVRLRESGEVSPGHLELVHRNASASPWGFGRWPEAYVGSNEREQSHEAAGSDGQGFSCDEGEAEFKVSPGHAQHRVGCSEANAFGSQPNEESESAPSGNGQDTVSAAVQDRGEIPRVVGGLGPSAGLNWPRIILDRETESRLQGRWPEEGAGADAEGMLHRVQEAPELDDLRSPNDRPLPQQEVGVPRGFRERPRLVLGSTGEDDPRICIEGIALERGLGIRQVDSVLEIPGPITVYNFSCEPGQAYEANGFVVHNCAYRMSGGFSTEQFAGPLGEKNPNRKIPTAKAMEILDDCAALGVKAIQFTGGGEPTVHPDHLKIFRHAQYLGLETSLVTNGVLFRQGWEGVLPRMKWVRVSIDAGTPEEYARVRRVKPEFYATAMGNVAVLAGEIRRQGTDCFLGVGYVVTRENWADAYDGIRLIRETGAANVRLSAMFSTEGADYYDGVYDDIKAEIARIKTLETDEFSVIDLFGNRISDLIQHAPDYDFCGYQQFNCYVGGNLHVYRCCTTAYTLHGDVGDLTNQSFASWFYSQNKADAYGSFSAKTCKTCQFNSKNRAISYLTQEIPLHVNFV